jgi:hypothetical protein
MKKVFEFPVIEAIKFETEQILDDKRNNSRFESWEVGGNGMGWEEE